MLFRSLLKGEEEKISIEDISDTVSSDIESGETTETGILDEAAEATEETAPETPEVTEPAAPELIPVQKTVDMKAVCGELKSTVSKDRKSYTLTVSDVVVPAGEKEVQFAVWNQKDTEEKAEFVTAQKGEDGNYSYEYPVDAAKAPETFEAKAYAVTKADEKVWMSSSTTFSSTKAEVEKETEAVEKKNEPEKEVAAAQAKDVKYNVISVQSTNVSAGTFRVKISNLKNASKVDKIQVPVWCAEDQSDIKWYEAAKQTDGSYLTTVKLSNHKYHVGTYKIHVYEVLKDSTRNFIGDTSRKMVVSPGVFNATTSSASNRFKATLSSAVIPGGAKSMSFAVWSAANGQDDLKWYTVTKNSAGNYALDIYLKNFKSSGTYNVHAYATQKNGEQIFVNSTTFEAAESGSVGKISVNNPAGSSSFKVTLSGITNGPSIKAVYVPVWCASDQSDIVWYKATRQSDGSYTVTCQISKHQYHTGTYKIHAYTESFYSGQKFAKSTSTKVAVKKGTVQAADSSSGAQNTYTATLSGAKIPGGIKSVTVAVWSKNGDQDDLKWSTATKNSNGTYSYKIKISDHKDSGEYNVHFYGMSMKNENNFLGSGTFSVSAPTAKVAVSSINGTKGTFKITVSNINAPSGITKVQIPVWHEGNQGDIQWYTPSKVNSTTYSITVSVKNHNYSFGDYNVHVYIQTGNGIETCVATKTTSITAKDFLFYNELGRGKVEVGIINPSGNVSNVYFPTWSEVGGQDDIVWYEGIQNGTTWTATVNSASHKHTGAYLTHVYKTINGEQIMAGALSYHIDYTAIANRKGIDISEWQGGIDWSKVAASQYGDFAMIRTTYGSTYTDPYFYANYTNARNAGVPVGIYHYTRAKTVAQAQTEALNVVKVLNGRSLDLPVAFDLEDENQRGLSATLNAQITNAFCRILSASGYKVMIYSSESWFGSAIKTSLLDSDIQIWCAKWSSTSPKVTGKNVDMWQYASDGSVPGIVGDVDMDILY